MFNYIIVIISINQVLDINFFQTQSEKKYEAFSSPNWVDPTGIMKK